jgi:hypothetical protein
MIHRGYNTVATLANLTVSSGTLTPAFSSTTYSYSVNVPYSTSSITLTATPTDGNATVVGDGLKNLNTGNNVFTITVTAQDEVTVITYTVTVNRGYNTVTTLSNLTVSAGTLTPVFSSTTYNYTVNVPYNMSFMTLAASPTDANATLSGVGLKNLNLGENAFIITVTAQDGVTTQNYTVTVNRAENTDATLANLSVSAGALSPMFNSATYNYTVNIPFSITSLTLAATATDLNATVTGAGLKSLNVGNNIFDITVTAQDGLTTQTYTITINRDMNTVATLASLTASEGELSPKFNSNVYTYFIDLSEYVTEITLTATPTDPNATVVGDGVKAISTGTNIFTITVTAQDNITELHYMLVITCPLGIAEPELPEIVVYPNPTVGELRIRNYESGIKSIEIIDMQGKKVSSFTSHSSPLISINISHLPVGTYFVRITTEKGMVMRKIVKE